VLQDKLKHSKILGSSLLQAELLFQYFVNLQDKPHFFAEVKTLPKDRCIYIYNNALFVADSEAFSSTKTYRLVWKKFAFRIALSFSELFLTSDKLIGYGVDTKLHSALNYIVHLKI
jgi:hypothetical protein